jgi:hypothetical protein
VLLVLLVLPLVLPLVLLVLLLVLLVLLRPPPHKLSTSARATTEVRPLVRSVQQLHQLPEKGGQACAGVVCVSTGVPMP